MSDMELNLRFNTAMALNLLSVIMSFATPYPWWQDVLIIVAGALLIALPLALKGDK